MNKLLFLLIVSCASAQVISPTNPYTKDFVILKIGSPGLVQQSSPEQAPKLSDIESAFEAYWEGKDFTAKGSGYKPFKRWGRHWQSYLIVMVVQRDTVPGLLGL
jgi:hypothetical protein